MRLEKRLSRPIHLRACPSAYIIFMGGGLFPLLVLNIVLVIKEPADPSIWKSMAVILIMMIGWAIWLASFQIVLTNDTISYTTLLRGTVTLKLSDIEKAELRIGVYQYTDRFRSPIRLELHPYKGNGKKAIIINSKVFRKEEINRLLEYLGVDKSTRHA